MLNQPFACGLCEKPPFTLQPQHSIAACTNCFQRIKTSKSISVTDKQSQNTILLAGTQISSVNLLDGLDQKEQDWIQRIGVMIEGIRNDRKGQEKKVESIVMFVGDRYLKEIERIVALWRKAVEEIKEIIVENTSWKIVQPKSKASTYSTINLSHVVEKSSHKASDKLTPQILDNLIKNIYKKNPQSVFSDQFSLSQKLNALRMKQLQGVKRFSIVSLTHFSHNVSLQNSMEKAIPPLELNKKKCHKNITSVVCSGITPSTRMKTESFSTKTQIEWLLHNSEHNPQGFRETTGPNTARKVSGQPMTQCISSALKLTTIANNSLSLTGFDVSKLAFDCYLNMTQWNNSVTSVKLVKVGLVDLQFNLLLCFAARHENLRNIVVTNNHLTEESLQMLLNFVRKIKQLQKVYMGNNHIKALVGKQIIRQIKELGIESIYI